VLLSEKNELGFPPDHLESSFNSSSIGKKFANAYYDYILHGETLYHAHYAETRKEFCEGKRNLNLIIRVIENQRRKSFSIPLIPVS
jgi:hypothetical protein